MPTHRVTLAAPLCALVLSAACGREPTGLGVGPVRVVARLAETASLSVTPVASALVNLYVIKPGSTGRRAIASQALAAGDAAKIGITSDAITVTLSFPLQGFGSVYELEGSARSPLGVKLFQLGPARFTEADVLTPGGAQVTLMITYVGPATPPAIPGVPPLPSDSVSPLPFPRTPRPVPIDTVLGIPLPLRPSPIVIKAIR